jgi:hypothetical protein
MTSITMWYRRHECGLRMAIFFSAATAAGAFGGLLARGIQEMDHFGGLRAWQWIFILEGIATFFVGRSSSSAPGITNAEFSGLIAYWVMFDYPSTANFLSDEEKIEVRRRLEADRDFLADEFWTHYVMDALKDWKIWVNCLITVGIFTPLYSVSLFLPTIIKDLGYTNNVAQMMTVSPYAFACVFCIACGYFADRFQQRGGFQVSCTILS